MENSFLQFKGKRIPYEISINGDIMICVTEMAKIIGKDVSGFLRLKKTKKYVELYMELNGIDSRSEFTPQGKLVKVVRGGEHNGTWMHESIALKFASWLSMEFEIILYQEIRKIEKLNYKYKKGIKA